MTTFSDITDFDPSTFEDPFRQLFIRMDKIYEIGDLRIYHTFPQERMLVDCIKSYNQIWSIRQNVNLQVSSLVDLTNFTLGFNNIYASFAETRKAAQKKYLSENLRFLTNAKRIFHDFDLNITDGVCTYNPRFDFNADLPIMMGQEDDSIINVTGIEFIRFISFIKTYSTQALMVVINHHRFKSLKSALRGYRIILDLKIQMINRDERNIKVSSYPIEGSTSFLEVTRMYTKFFEG